MPPPTRVLFVCIHNSARSQMAEAFVNHLGGARFLAESAGLEPGRLNPVVISIMSEIGIDISGNKTKSVADMIQSGERYSYVITVCDEASAERCPVFPGQVRRLHWSFPDPSRLPGDLQEQIAATRKIRDDIKKKVEDWLKSPH